MIWNQPLPQKGWKCLDVVEGSGSCEMCGKEDIRFIHIMKHPKVNDEISVGCVCAEKMSNDYVNPRRRESALKSTISRRKKWLTRRWRISAKGNEFLNYRGSNVGVYKRDDCWGYWIDGKFSNNIYNSSDQAKLELFNAL